MRARRSSPNSSPMMVMPRVISEPRRALQHPEDDQLPHAWRDARQRGADEEHREPGQIDAAGGRRDPETSPERHRHRRGEQETREHPGVDVDVAQALDDPRHRVEATVDSRRPGTRTAARRMTARGRRASFKRPTRAGGARGHAGPVAVRKLAPRVQSTSRQARSLGDVLGPPIAGASPRGGADAARAGPASFSNGRWCRDRRPT